LFFEPILKGGFMFKGKSPFAIKALGLICASVMIFSASINATPITISSDYQGWVNSVGIGNGASNGLNTFTGNEYGNYYNSWASFDLSSLSGPVSTAELSLEMATWPQNSSEIYTIDIFDVSTSLTSFQTASSGVAGYNDLMTGNQYGTLSAGNGQYLVTLNSAAIADINANLGGTFIFGFTNATLNSQDPIGVDIGEYINGFWGQAQDGPKLITNAASVPEPSSFVFITVSLLALSGFFFRSRKRE
jgi:hypothetical protein